MTPDAALETPVSPSLNALVERVVAEVEARAGQLQAWRREVHQHPEVAWQESRTTALVCEQLSAAGGRVRTLPTSGALVDLGAAEPRLRIALRGDMDALPVDEVTGLPFASEVEGACHACGHDVHTVGLLGAGLALLAMEQELVQAGLGVRLIFQPAEESHPGGALHVMEHGGLDGVDRIFALHCDPQIDVHTVGLRAGPITAASDEVRVVLTGRGGHTSRPQLTQDLTFALAKVVTEVPAVLGRRLDVRAGVSLVWGRVSAGTVANVIPAKGEAVGTLRMLDADLWQGIAPVVKRAVEEVVAPYGVTATVHHTRGVPPVDNDSASVVALSRAAMLVLGAAAVRPTPQSMGGEDLGWFLQKVPGAMGRLGTRTPGGPTFDLHQGDLVVDERAVLVAAKVLAASVFSAVPAGAEGHASS